MQAGKSNQAIAEVLGGSKSTMGRELERNSGVLDVGSIGVKKPKPLQRVPGFCLAFKGGGIFAKNCSNH